MELAWWPVVAACDGGSSGGSRGVIILLVTVVLLLLLACPPHWHNCSPFCRPLLFLQHVTHLPTTLPSMVGCCVGALHLHQQLQQKQPTIVVFVVVVYLRHCPSPCSGRLAIGTITSRVRGWTTATSIAATLVTDRPSNRPLPSHLVVIVVTPSSSPPVSLFCPLFLHWQQQLTGMPVGVAPMPSWWQGAVAARKRCVPPCSTQPSLVGRYGLPHI